MRRAYNKLVAAFAASLDVALVSLCAPWSRPFSSHIGAPSHASVAAMRPIRRPLEASPGRLPPFGARSCGRYPPPEGPRSHLTTTTTATTTNVSRSIPLCLFLARLPPAGHQSITRSLLIIYRRQSRRIAIKCARLPSKPPPPDPITL